MSGKSVIDQIRHYQKDIERCPENSERMIRCIQRLYVLPILVQHLQETGVGRSVNSLRKYNGEVGDAAKALVAKWKAMVAAEESSEGEQIQDPPPTDVQEVTSPVPLEHPLKHNKEKEKSRSNESNNHKKHENSRHQTDRNKHHTSSSGSSSRKSTTTRESSKNSSTRHKHSSYDSDKRKHSSSRDKKRKSSAEEERTQCRKKRRKHSSPEIEKKKDKELQKISENTSDSEEERENLSSSDNDSCDKLVENNQSDVENDSVEENSDADNDAADDDDEEEEEVEGEENYEEIQNDSEESDHRHRSKHHITHKHKSSHSNKEKIKEHSGRLKERNSTSSHNSHKHSSYSSKKSNSDDLKKLIKENEKRVKKEKISEKSHKVKIERNEDGSVDNASGASFADALLGMDMPAPKKKKKQPYKSEKLENSPTSSNSIKVIPSSSSHSSSTSKKSKSSSSSKPTVDIFKEPELLSKNVKLEALDLDISSTLPEIDPNYKPLPHIPEHSLRRNNKPLSEEETMFSIMTTKNQRTKVFSGAKHGCYVAVPSLYSLCIQLLYENIEAVEYTGGVPYDLLKPLLEKLNADQLYVLEHYNPYLIEDTDSLWQFHCKKDFRSEARSIMESWRELYLRCMEEREKKLKELTANITQSMAKSTPVRTAKLAYVDTVAKPPRNVARKQAKFGTGTAKASLPTSNSSSSGTNNPNKQQIVSKAVVGGHTPGVVAKDVVPPPPKESSSSFRPLPSFLKKKKAPLMAKALQLIKGNRFKR